MQPKAWADRDTPGHSNHGRGRAGAELFAFGLDDFAATIKAVGADMVTQMRFAGGRLDGQRRIGQKIVRTVHAALGRGFFVLLDSHFLLLENSFHPSDGAFTFCVHGRQRQAQQHFILNQIDEIQRLADQNRIAVGQRIQPFQLGLVARQMQRAFDLHRMPHGTQAALTRHLDLAANRQPQGQAAALISLPGDSTEQRALRKFAG